MKGILAVALLLGVMGLSSAPALAIGNIIGAGVVGAASAFAIQADGHDVVLIDREVACPGTSFGNARARSGLIVMNHKMESRAVPKVLDSDFQPAISRTAKNGQGDSSAHRTMAQDDGGAPRIHAELTKLGFIISEITVLCYMPRRPAEPDQVKRRIAFLRNHKDDIAAMDLFIHRTDRVASADVRLLRHRARPSAHRSLQRDVPPDLRLGDSAIA